MNDLHARLTEMGRRARQAQRALAAASSAQRTTAIRAMGEAVRRQAPEILAANRRDLDAGRAAGLDSALLDRLALDDERLAGIAGMFETIAALPDPVGEETARWTRPNGLDIARVRTPIGVLAVIYESRPNVTADAAALSLRAGNAVILRGGSEALQSSLAIHAAVAEALSGAGLPAGAVQMIDTTDRVAVGALLGGLGGTIDLVIPRGGRSLVERVKAEARVPVLGHLEGVNHVYVHQSADPDVAREVVLNAKMRRVSVCGAAETLLIDRALPDAVLLPMAEALRAAGCEVRADAETLKRLPWAATAEAGDWTTEYLAPILSVRTVDGPREAMAHIAACGTGHTEAIIATDQAVIDGFLSGVDAGIVIANASTQFADGGEFGFGGEIGISTDRLHARGPVGAEQLTSFKYVVRGSGQTRP